MFMQKQQLRFRNFHSKYSCHYGLQIYSYKYRKQFFKFQLNFCLILQNIDKNLSGNSREINNIYIMALQIQTEIFSGDTREGILNPLLQSLVMEIIFHKLAVSIHFQQLYFSYFEFSIFSSIFIIIFLIKYFFQEQDRIFLQV